MLAKSGRVRSILARLGFEDDDASYGRSSPRMVCDRGPPWVRRAIEDGAHAGMVVLKVMVLRRERQPELGRSADGHSRCSGMTVCLRSGCWAYELASWWCDTDGRPKIDSYTSFRLSGGCRGPAGR